MKSSAFSLRRTLGAVTSASLCLANGRADISDFTSVGTIEAEAQVAIRPDNDHFDPNPARDDDRPPDEFDVASFNKSARADATKAGLRAKGRAQEQAQVSFDAHNFSFSASGTTEATASRTGDPLKDNNTGAGGSIGFAVRFRIDSKSRFALGGNVSVQTNGSTGSSEAQVVLEGRTDDGKEVKFDFDAEDDPGDPRTISISKSGELEPGSYSVSVFALSTIGSDQPTSRCSMNASFTLFSPTPAPDTGEEIRWTNAAGGSYFDPANWRPQRVPVKTAERSDTAIFGLATSYDVTLSDPAGPTFTLGAGAGSCERCLVTSGSVLDLGGGSLTVFGTSLVDPSFVVTRDAKLNLTGGTLLTRNALLGKDANRLGEAHVFNTGTRWENNGRMTIGERGEGKLFIANGGFVTALETILGADSAQGSAIVGGDGSQWETGNLVVGSKSRGNLTIEAGGAVNSGDVVISVGDIDGANSVGVSGASGSGVASSWLVTGKLEVGRAGIGICAITGGGIVECDRLLVSTGSGALGLVGVSGLQSETTRSTLNATAALIGAESSATLTVEKGALARFSGGPFFLGFTAPGQIDVSGFDAATGKDSELRVSSSDFPFSIGTGANGLGELTISGGASATVECPRMEIGESNFGIGLVTVEGEGGGLASTLFVTGTLEIGGEGAGQGVLTLNRGTVDVIGDVNVLSNGILQGIGTLTVSGQITSDGIISPGLSPGTLTIKGNFVQGANGIVRAEIAGQAAGAEHDQLVITGNASFGGKLVLQFMNGFAPHAGDKFDVIAASGTTNSNFSEVQVTGLQAGAQFDANTSGGVLTATALNDGVALPTVSLAVSGKKKKAAEKGRKPAVFLISRTGDDTAPLTVSYEVSGTAENGVDYLFLDGIAVIPARKTAVAVKVKPFDDQSAEGPETIALKIVPGADYTHSLESSAAVTLLDNERKEPLN